MYMQNPPHREHSHGGADFYRQKRNLLLELVRGGGVRLNLIQIRDRTHRSPQMELNREYILGLGNWGSGILGGILLL